MPEYPASYSGWVDQEDYVTPHPVPRENYHRFYFGDLPRVDVGKLNKDVEAIKNELAEIKGLLNEVLRAMVTEAVECREVSGAEARELILDLIKSHPDGLCYSEIIDALNIDPDLVIDVCDALAAEGKLKDLGPVSG
jgi:hypothetical protein